jgi:hypothetical protein
MNVYYNGIWRMDWGLGNPNKTATLVACLMIAIWAIPLGFRRGFWPTLIIVIGLAWCLVQTYSRGGMVSFLMGTAVLLAWVPRPWSRSRWLGVVASLWILGGFVLYAKAQTRYGQGLFTEDQSIDNRLVIWQHVPEMMAAAPWGWGWGKAGDSYTQWFQPPNNALNYLNLVNSHFTWMVEGGWLASILYLFAWFAIFLLCWPVPGCPITALPLAIWTTFAVGAFFSHVEESFWLWIIPLLSLGGVGVARFRSQRWPPLSSFLWSITASVGIVAILILLGVATSTLPIVGTPDRVTLGRSSDQTVIFVDRKIMGSLYGHTFRKFLARNPDQLNKTTFIFVESSSGLPSSSIACLVVGGRFAQKKEIISNLDKGENVILINPTCSPDETGLDESLVAKTLVYFGEYSQVPSRSSWSSYPGVKAFQIDGASDFVPSWPEAILIPHKT